MKKIQMDFQYLSETQEAGVARIRGEVDMTTVPEFSEFINKVLEAPCKKLLFDLKNLTYMSSTGFGILASAAIEEKDKGEKLIFFCSLHPTILNTYTLFGMEQVWKPCESIEEALKCIDMVQPLEEEEKQVTFPLIRSCTHCHRPSNFFKPGHYKCPYCKTIHQLNDKGELKQIIRPKKRLPQDSQKEVITDEIDITLPSDAVHLSRIRDFIFSFLNELFNEQVRANIAMAVDEACANAIEHAHQFDRKKKINLHLEVSCRKFTLTIKDNGENTFNKVIQKDRINQDQLKETGRGMGLILIKQMMDEVNLKPTDTWGTSITMTKYVKEETLPGNIPSS